MPRGVSRFRAAEQQTVLLLDSRTKAALTADVDNYSLLEGASFAIGGTGGTWTINGIAGGTAGRVIELVNYLALPVWLGHEKTSSLAQNRINTSMPGNAVFILNPGASIFMSYSNDLNRWVVLHSAVIFDPELDTPLATLLATVRGFKRGGGMMTKSRFVQLLGSSQGFLKTKFTNKISGDTATQAFGVVSGCQVSFSLPAQGDVIVGVSASAFPGIAQILTGLTIGVRFNSDTAIALGTDSIINGGGDDFVGEVHMCALFGKNLAAGAHTADLCWGDANANYTLYSNSTRPATITVWYPG